MKHGFTRREDQIFRLNTAGFSVKEMADHIGCEVKTVEKMLDNIKKKTGLQKNTELVALYFCDLMGISFAEFKRVQSTPLFSQIHRGRVSKSSYVELTEEEVEKLKQDFDEGRI